MWEMLGLIFAAVNAATLLLLVRRRYYKLFPCFVAALALTAWQAGVTLLVPASPPDYATPRQAAENLALNQTWWAPGEVLLLALTGLALLESVWKSTGQMEAIRRRWTFAGMLVGVVFLVYDMGSIPSGGWYTQFLGMRVWYLLGCAVFAFFGWWAGMITNHVWPRVLRMHMSLMATLAIFHAIFSSGASWQSTNLNFRSVEIMCCVGWWINSRFLVREFGEAQRSRDAALLPFAGLTPAQLRFAQSERRAAFLER